MMSDKLKNLLIRSFSGAVMIAVFFAAILGSQLSFKALMLLVMIGCQCEFYKLCRAGGMTPQQNTGLISGIALYFVNFCIFSQLTSSGSVSPRVSGVILPLALYFLVMLSTIFICELWHKSKTPIANISTTLAGVIYTAVPISLLLYIPLLLNGGVWNPWVMLGYMFIVWGNDVFAYLVGSMIGRHKLAERISPKKSWEGFFGGIAGAVLIGWGVSTLIAGSAAIWCGLAAFVAVTGVAGDLVESMFKRSVGVKDSGNIMPGHGGWLDRFDALLVSTPFAFVYLLLTL